MKLTMNGHLLPFFGHYGNRIVLAAQDRGAVHKVLGAAHITYRDAAGGQSYSVHHNKIKGFRQGIRMAGNICRLLWRYRDLKASWTNGYLQLTQGSFWHVRLGLPETGPPQP
jgi:hypothetical protein